MASGQLGTIYSKINDAPVILSLIPLLNEFRLYCGI